MSRKQDFREASRGNWHRTIEGNESEWPGFDRLNAGSLMRIADATEKMASNYQRMETDLAWYKRMYAERGQEIERLKRSRAGYMAALTKLKRKISG